MTTAMVGRSPLVDGEPAIRSLLQALLGESGLGVVTADDVLGVPLDGSEVLAWTRGLVSDRGTPECLGQLEDVLASLAAVIEARSLYPHDHARRVARRSAQLACALGVDGEAVGIIRRAALLHDVGLIGVPESIRQKLGPLRPDELILLKQHPATGADLCRPLPHGREISAIVRGHHEWWNGDGYPDGLAGDDIPLGARIIAVADAFEVCMTERSHGPALTPDEAMEVLWFGAGTQWEARLVERFEPLVGTAAETLLISPVVDA